MAESDRRPGESERDWMRRITRMAGEQQRARRDEAIERRMKGEAQWAREQEALNSLSDSELDEFKGMFGVDLSDMMKGAEKGYVDKDAAAAAREVQKSIGKRGLFGGSVAKSKMRKHKAALKKGAKEVKKKKGCLWAAVALFSLGISATGGLGWGVYEGVTSLIG